MLDVASALTGKSFSKNTFLFATAGRNEYRNKGIDMFIDAVNTLHNENPARAAIAFILVPAWSMSPRADLQSRLQNATKQSDALPEPVITHTLHNYSSDTIYNRIEYLGLLNGSQTNINVIYVPCYLNGNDGIFDMTYYELLPGFDAAVFPPTMSRGDIRPKKDLPSASRLLQPICRVSANGFYPNLKTISKFAGQKSYTAPIPITRLPCPISFPASRN